jgi:ATP dependent DNA ligase domain
LVSASPPHPFADALRRGLQTLGYSEGRNIALEFRYSGGRSDRAGEIATEFVRLGVDVIVAHFTPAVIKHDGFRIIARKDGDRVRLYSRPGNDMTRRFPLIAEALTGLRSRSCIIDGEAVACDDSGLTSFERIRYRQHDGDVFLYAFDLIELNGDDLRRDPLQVRKATLASIVAKARPGIRFNEHIEGDGPTHGAMLESGA